MLRPPAFSGCTACVGFKHDQPSVGLLIGGCPLGRRYRRATRDARHDVISRGKPLASASCPQGLLKLCPVNAKQPFARGVDRKWLSHCAQRGLAQTLFSLIRVPLDQLGPITVLELHCRRPRFVLYLNARNVPTDDEL